MKVFHVLFSVGTGGAERFVVDLSNAMADVLDEIYIVTIKDDKIGDSSFYKDEISNKVKYINLNRNILTFSTFVFLYNFLRKESPDIVHFHAGNLIFWFIFPIIFLRKIRYVQTLHSQAQNEYGSKIRMLIRKFLYKRKYVSVITISPSNDNSFRKVYETQSLSCIYNGRATPNLSPNYNIIQKEILQLKNNQDTLMFCHVARFNKIKNQSMLVQAFNDLIDENLNVVLLIIGDHFDTVEGIKVKNIARNGIYFLGPKKNIIDYLTICDFFCLSSFYEGMPITLIEAYSTGCIPVTTPVSGCIDIIKDGLTGFISPDFTKESYKTTIKRAIEERYKIKRSQLVEYYKQNLSMSKCCSLYCCAYQKILLQ